MYVEHKARELQPFSECPVWARLQFMKTFPEIYFWDGNHDTPRMMSEILVKGFQRDDEPSDMILIEFEMDWITEDEFVTYEYFFPVYKKFS